MSPSGREPAPEMPDTADRVAEEFVRRRFGAWSSADEARLQERLAADPAAADAMSRVEQVWQAAGEQATTPELMKLREQAIARSRRSRARRWLGEDASSQFRRRVAAAVAVVVVGLVTALQFSPYGYRPGTYSTDIGEQRTLELPDHSRLVLDSKTRVRVRFSQDARVVQLLDGRAEFAVAKDHRRPFRVEAGEGAIVALGTVFTVEYVDRQLHVAMLEGRVAVTTRSDAVVAKPGIELATGEELRVRPDGQATVIEHGDLEAATAWRQGKVVFRNESLAQAVRRLNRSSRIQIVVDDPALASLQLSGVFDAGDTRAFADAIQAYLPLTVEQPREDTLRLVAKPE